MVPLSLKKNLKIFWGHWVTVAPKGYGRSQKQLKIRIPRPQFAIKPKNYPNPRKKIFLKFLNFLKMFENKKKWLLCLKIYKGKKFEGTLSHWTI